MPAGTGGGEHVDEAAYPLGVDAAGGRRERGRADLDHDPAGRGDLLDAGPRRSCVLVTLRRSRHVVGVVGGADLVARPGRPGWSIRRATSARVSALAALGHGLVDRAAPAMPAGRFSSKRWSSPRRPSISTPASMPGLKSKTTALSGWPIRTASPSTAPSWTQPRLDAEPVEPVGQEADGLVVAEVGLAHPALGLRRRAPASPRRSR